ncbi:MAG: thioredoxin family protein [Anaerolineales bacterium]|nr:thioredoxin family protein [Anaerolineales bacterium]MCX7608106.1 thioredoxin family protein [Anaerolineales bacterium]MDW8228059.1 thioredoxin family protein [Anaerolineales bacterium]
MLSGILERSLVVLVLLIGLLAAFWLLNRFLLRQAGSRLAEFSEYRPGLPAIVYFTTPTCAPCRTQQRPAIRRLQERLGNWFQVIEVDAGVRPDVAHRWGVMSVPTTFVFDAQGRPRYVNHGVVSAETLLKQLDLEDFSI